MLKRVSYISSFACIIWSIWTGNPYALMGWTTAAIWMHAYYKENK